MVRLVKEKECLVPTFFGWLVMLAALALCVTFYLRNIHSFLSISKPVKAQVLIVEDWLRPESLESAASEFNDHGYVLLLLLGEEKRWVVSILEKAGVDKKKIVTVPIQPVRKDRTFSSAIAAKNWLLSSGMSGEAVNVFVLGAHSRRSLMLFEKAFGSDFEIGVISCENVEYDPQRWWESSAGFKTVVDETIAYIYTQFFLLLAGAPSPG
jgi:hypothetical protein